MEKGMREPYIEGVATHDGPESCVGVCEGGGEALTGVRAGRAIEPRNQESGAPTPLSRSEGNIAGGVRRESPVGPARSENQGMYGIFMRENREVPLLVRRVDHRRAVQGTLRRYA
jgi:RNA-directed DNA polymerase